MKVVEFTTRQLEELCNYENLVQSGCEGYIYTLDKDTLFKFYRQHFIPHTSGNNYSSIREVICEDKKNFCRQPEYFWKDGKSIYIRLSPYERMEKLISKQKKIKLTTLPLGVATIDEWVVGAILKYHKNHISYEDFIKKAQPKELKKSLVDLKRRIVELKANDIYQRDLHENNILIGNENKIEIIDLDTNYTIVSDCPNDEDVVRASRCYENIEELVITQLNHLDTLFEDKVVAKLNNLEKPINNTPMQKKWCLFRN